MADVVLCTLNARYAHASLGLRCLLANLGEVRARATLLEFDLQERPADVVEAILAMGPKIVGLGVYIWNVGPMSEVVALLKTLAPEVAVVLGGPEVSHELEEQPIVRLANHVITGEGEDAFRVLCEGLLEGRHDFPKVLKGGLPDLARLRLPHAEFSDQDLAHRLLYVEASRGCPFRCEFCLSSLDEKVRPFPLPNLFSSLESLLSRGARHFKFVDRTFNLDVRASTAILDFFLERWTPGMFLHFELIPDRLQPALRERLARFPAGGVQLEIGLQTLNAEVTRRISRVQDLTRCAETFAFLRQHTQAHLHADLIVGLPGEDLESFGKGFDTLRSWGPQEIQVGVLKRLRGTPIQRHQVEFGLVFAPIAPYEVLATNTLSFVDVQRLKRFARTWDLFGNSGRFPSTLPLLFRDEPSDFAAFLRFSDWLTTRTTTRAGISLARQFELLVEYLGPTAPEVLERALVDYRRGARTDTPKWLRAPPPESPKPRPTLPPRQSRFHEDDRDGT